MTWLTPRKHRPAFQSVYAFCRWSDDLGDEIGDPARSLELLNWWRDELRAMYDGRARHPVMIALRETVERYSIPPEPFHALIDAFVQDQTVTEYETFDQLRDYCTRSADPVGRLVLYIGGAFNDDNARLSDATCTALQLANFWQDVARDLAIGRIYLPREDRKRFGYGDDDLHSLRFTPAFAELLKFEIERTRDLFEIGRAGPKNSLGTGRRRRSVFEGRAGDPPTDRGMRLQRPFRTAEVEQGRQGPAAGKGGDRPDLGEAAGESPAAPVHRSGTLEPAAARWESSR